MKLQQLLDQKTVNDINKIDVRFNSQSVNASEDELVKLLEDTLNRIGVFCSDVYTAMPTDRLILVGVVESIKNADINVRALVGQVEKVFTPLDGKVYVHFNE